MFICEERERTRGRVMRFKRRERRLAAAGPDKDVIVFAPAPTAHVEGP